MASRPVLPVKFENEEILHPFDELDPCCQRELMNAKHRERVTTELRRTDRLQNRLNERTQAITSLRQGSFSRCECCSHKQDYALLSKYKQALEGAAKLPKYRGPYPGLNTSFKFGDEAVAKGVSRDVEYLDQEDDWDTDDEALLEGVEAIVGHTEDEAERLKLASESKAAMDRALAGGFGEHIEDSARHVCTLVRDNGETVVCHVYQPLLPLCAWLDIYFEKLAKQYLGTRFRRVEASPDARHYFSHLCRRSAVDEIVAVRESSTSSMNAHFARKLEEGLKAQLPVLMCFVKGELVALETGLQQFGHKDGVYESDALTYLQNTHVLHSRLEDSMNVSDLERLTQRLHHTQTGNEDEDSDDEGRWCDVPGCRTKYIHTHIGTSSENQISLVPNAEDKGFEVLGGRML